MALPVPLLTGVLLVAAWRTNAPEISVAQIVRKEVSACIASNGQVEPSDPHVIVARVDSFVRGVHVTPGTMVSRPPSLVL